jgi:type II secretory pathway pseudopilin PulG
MKIDFKKPTGFSLVEVVLALGITSFALLVIFAMFNSPLQLSSAITEQQEAVGIARALPGWLKDQVQNQHNFPGIYGWVQTPVATTATPAIYAFCLPSVGAATSPNAPARVVVCNATDSTSMAGASSRQGRLFGIYLTISPNYPVETTGGTVASPGTASLTGFADYKAYILGNTTITPTHGNPMLAVQAAIYALPGTTATPGKTAYPSLTYDVVIPCF